MARSRIDCPRSPTRAEQVADAAVHILGVVAALAAVPVLITLAAVWKNEAALVAAVSVYGASLLAMLALSAGYNIANIRAVRGRLLEALRRLDHAAIYVKIAGTYTPYAVITGGAAGRWMLIGVWTGALAGSLGKLIAPAIWERASVLLYLALGWSLVLFFEQVANVISPATSILIVVGGALYSIGVVFFLWEKLPFQNAIWHLFVLVASFVFYAAILVEITVST